MRGQFTFEKLETGRGVAKRKGQEKSQRKMTFDLGLKGRFASLGIIGNAKHNSQFQFSLIEIDNACEFAWDYSHLIMNFLL